MKGISGLIIAGSLVCASVSGLARAETEPPKRPYFNDQKAPESLEDLRAIQKAVQSHLENARAATVCIELEEGTGTGVIISPEGLVLTAAHVSTGIDVPLTLVLEDGRKFKAKSLGLNSENDAAMVQITDQGSFPFVPYKTVTDYKLGDWVFALGHSGGFDEARGVVTRVGRLVAESKDTIQSDCVLIGGDSGGPLFDMSGNLIAIHSRVGRVKDDSRHVPLEAFERSWSAMKDGEFLGQGPFAQPKVPEVNLGMRTNWDQEAKKLTILEVEEEGLAHAAGLESGMEILAINGREITDLKYFETLLKTAEPGDEIVFRWAREEEAGEITVELEVSE